MSKPQVFHRFEPLLDWGNDLTSLWGPFRRRLPAKDVKIRAPFALLWAASCVFVVVFGALAALVLIYMMLGRPLWYPAVTSGRLSLLFVASYYVNRVTHYDGFVLFYLAPALTLAVNTLTIAAWNRRARRLQTDGPPREAETVASDGTWPPPPAYRK